MAEKKSYFFVVQIQQVSVEVTRGALIFLKIILSLKLLVLYYSADFLKS